MRSRARPSALGLVLATALGCTSRVAPIEHDTEGGTTGGAGGSSVGPSDSSSTAAATSTTTPAADSSSDSGETTASTSTGAAAVCGLPEADASVAVWEAMRDEAGNTYWYVGRRTTGVGKFRPAACLYHTLVVVEDGVVVRRRMQDGEQNGEDPCAAGWDEVGDDLGIHDSLLHGLPAPVWTLDEVYASCCALLSENADPDLAPVFYPWGDGLFARCFLNFAGAGTGYTVGPPEWGDEIDIEDIGFGPPPR